VLIYLAVAAGVFFFFTLARVFRKTLGTAQRPQFVMEKPPLPKGLSETVLQIEKWKSQGRISREDYERLMFLCQEDAEKAATKETSRDHRTTV
jgi:hypothetical protein